MRKTAPLTYSGATSVELIIETQKDLEEYSEDCSCPALIVEPMAKHLARGRTLRVNGAGGWCGVEDLGIDPATLVITESGWDDPFPAEG